jgi:CheY-like chemotaxis protein
MTRILLVENDPEWLDSIPRSLPHYNVDLAPSYNEALRCIDSGVVYDVAIVDLNLIDSADRNSFDLLGGEILLVLRQKVPATRRIALTAFPPGAVREQVFDRYAAHLPANARALRSALWEDFRSWRDHRVLLLEQHKRMLRNDLRASSHGPADGGDSSAGLSALESRRSAFDQDCSRVEAMLGSIGGVERIPAVSQEIDRLKSRFGTEAGDAAQA